MHQIFFNLMPSKVIFENYQKLKILKVWSGERLPRQVVVNFKCKCGLILYQYLACVKAVLILQEYRKILVCKKMALKFIQRLALKCRYNPQYCAEGYGNGVVLMNQRIVGNKIRLGQLYNSEHGIHLVEKLQ